MMRKLLRYMRSLPGKERRLLFQAWFLLLAVDLGLRVARFRSIHRYISRVSKSSTSKDIPVEVTIQSIARSVEIAGRHHLYPMTCLRRALALQWMLARRGIETKLCFGVRRAEGLEAHAWLEYHNQPIGQADGSSHQFAPLTAP
jgi:hypothetical protein